MVDSVLPFLMVVLGTKVEARHPPMRPSFTFITLPFRCRHSVQSTRESNHQSRQLRVMEDVMFRHGYHYHFSSSSSSSFLLLHFL